VAASHHGDTPHSGKTVTSVPVTPYTTSVDVNLGPNVIIEWGFKVALLGCVRQLRAAGFDAWWLDGEEAAARQGYISRKGYSPSVMAAYRVQVEEIRAAWPRLERFYGDHVIRTVTFGPTYKPFDEIASIMFPDVPG
jgi:hypothetical protein